MVLHKVIADKNGGRQVELSAEEEKATRAEWALEEFKKKALDEGRILAHAEVSSEELKVLAKEELSLGKEYSALEIAEAQLMNDLVKIQKIKERKQVLDAAYKEFSDTLDGVDEDAKKIAKAQFKRPV